MEAIVKATGKIVEVELVNMYRFNDCSFVEVFRDLNVDTLYFGHDLDFDIEGKFAENCLNGIKQDQDIVHEPDYYTRLEHQYAGMAMQQLVTLVNVGYEYVYEETAIIAFNFAHALVEKLKELEERK